MPSVKQATHIRYRNERHKAVAGLFLTCNNVASRLQRMLSDYNLTLQQYNILRILQRQHPDPSCNCTIRDQLLVARSDITRIVDRLIKEDLVIRTMCSNDRRKVNIMITDKGLALLDKMRPLNDKMDHIVSCLDSREIAIFNRLLEKIRIQEE